MYTNPLFSGFSYAIKSKIPTKLLQFITIAFREPNTANFVAFNISHSSHVYSYSIYLK